MPPIPFRPCTRAQEKWHLRSTTRSPRHHWRQLRLPRRRWSPFHECPAGRRTGSVASRPNARDGGCIVQCPTGRRRGHIVAGSMYNPADTERSSAAGRRGHARSTGAATPYPSDIHRAWVALTEPRSRPQDPSHPGGRGISPRFEASRHADESIMTPFLHDLERHMPCLTP